MNDVAERKEEQNGLLVNYGISNEQIAETKARYASLTIAPDGTGYEEVRVALGEVRRVRTGVEKKRVQLKADALKFGRLVDDEAKRITSLLTEIEEPLKAKKKVVDDEKERVKREAEEAERRAEEERLRAQREAEEARLRAIREAEEKRLTEERAKLEQERQKILAERKKAEEELLAARAAEREKLRAEQAEMERRNRLVAEENERIRAAQQAENERIAAERRKLDEEKAAKERAEFEARARAEAEKAAKEKAEREAQEKARQEAEWHAARAEEQMRLQALKPDVEKVHDFSNRLMSVTAPDVSSEEAKAVVNDALLRLAMIADDLDRFDGKKKKKREYADIPF